MLTGSNYPDRDHNYDEYFHTWCSCFPYQVYCSIFEFTIDVMTTQWTNRSDERALQVWGAIELLDPNKAPAPQHIPSCSQHERQCARTTFPRNPEPFTHSDDYRRLMRQPSGLKRMSLTSAFLCSHTNLPWPVITVASPPHRDFKWTVQLSSEKEEPTRKRQQSPQLLGDKQPLQPPADKSHSSPFCMAHVGRIDWVR